MNADYIKKVWIFMFYLKADAANKIASTKFGSEAPISVTESIMGKARSIQASGFKEKECKLRFSCFLQDLF